MIICTAATRNSVYEPLLSVQRHIYGERIITSLYPDMRWSEGTKIKPSAIRNAFNQDNLVFWMDADCAVELPDEPPEGKWDICIFDNIHPTHLNRISSAFILFRDTPMTQKFLSRWEKNNTLYKKDHPALTKTINEMRGQVDFYDGSEWLKGKMTLNALLPERGLYK
jgi:hypothetical protein